MTESAVKTPKASGKLTEPTLSVIIPAYKTAEFIAEALDSVFAQTFNNFEVIVINDGSPDTSELEQVLASFRKRIIYLKQENQGPGAARNLGIRHARGEYIAFLDSDDSWLPDYLASQMKLFEEIPSFDVVYSDAQYFGNPDFAGKTYMQICPSTGPVTLESLIREDCQVITSCSVARRQVVIDVGLFDESLDFRGSEDFDLWLRILNHGGHIAYQRKVLGRYRSRPGSLSQDSIKVWETVVAVFEKAARTMTLPDETRAILQKQIAQSQAYFDLESGRKYLTSRNYDRARDSLAKANDVLNRNKLKLLILGLRVAPLLTRWGMLAWQKFGSGSGIEKSGQHLHAD